MARGSLHITICFLLVCASVALAARNDWGCSFFFVTRKNIVTSIGMMLYDNSPCVAEKSFWRNGRR